MFDTEARAWTVWLEDIDCSGDESNIQDCPHSAWGDKTDENCEEGAEVAIVCNEPISEIRLVGGKTAKEGVVQIKLRSEWRSVCAGSEEGFKWTDVEAKVVCRQLGYDGWAFAVASQLFESRLRVESQSDKRLWSQKIRCDGQEEALVLCQHTPNWVEDIYCTEEERYGGHAAVICEEDRIGFLSTTSTPNITPEIGDGMPLGLVSSSNTSKIVLVIIICILVIVVIILLVVLLINRRKTHSYIATGQSDYGDAGEGKKEEPLGESRL
ncbi:CD5 antigen-like [Amphiura filiformis]|uniref:CD5 antigen-like n=1 Tax=Amphiura filiformis TaxID=82378 RepID=UPI003B211D62